MRAALHVAATLVLVPYVALALGFVLLGSVIAAGSLPAMFMRMIDQASWLFPWGLLAFLVPCMAATGFGAWLARAKGEPKA